jgi:hypothetical protein
MPPAAPVTIAARCVSLIVISFRKPLKPVGRNSLAYSAEAGSGDARFGGSSCGMMQSARVFPARFRGNIALP